MCGIVGILNFRESSATKGSFIVKKMSDPIKHRGPDAYGDWSSVDDGIFLAHRRLSVIDISSSGSQPMISSSGRYVISFNGEIYNHEYLRQKCSNFCNWNGSSDTESLLEAIETYGLDKTLEISSGMFAFALWDKKNKELFLVRDRAGEKPLYFSKCTDEKFNPVIFGSDLKSLRQYPSFDSQLDSEAIKKFINLGYVPNECSIYKNVKKISPGTYIKFNKEGEIIKETTYWSARELNDDISISKIHDDNFYIDSLEKLCFETVEDYMISDVPLGAFLSGGIDSSLIVSIMQKISTNPIKTFSIGFHDKEFDESIYASAVANHLKTDHTELKLSSEDALESINRILDSYDEPFADSSQIPTFLVSELARQNVTVSISGDGADELFGGYRRHYLYNKYGNTIFSIPYFIRKIGHNFGYKLAKNRFIENAAVSFLKSQDLIKKVPKFLKCSKQKTLKMHILN